ncbi:MAG: DUF1800 domain-containing protein [Kiritimatiellia bacterium]
MAKTPQISRRKWNRKTAAHLAVRAGFGPAPAELDHLQTLRPAEAVDTFLEPQPPATLADSPEWFQRPEALLRSPQGLSRKELYQMEEQERRNLQRAFQKEQQENLRQARIWWLERMVQSTHPLEEKLTLFWHGHFATSVQKVRGSFPMIQQNLLFRRQGQGSWRQLLLEISQDPAMLIYLDNAGSNKQKPNENYARELLELFTLGEGNYAEEDIRNAARAFTGWSVHPGRWEFQTRPRQMDLGEKHFLNATGPLRGEEIVDEILRQPQAADFLAERLWKFFASEIPNPAAQRDISRSLRASDFDLHTALRTLFLHEDFYHPSVIRGQIKSPVQLTAHLVRTLQCDPVPGTQMMQACQQLGQKLFEPPSVKGWDGGAAWITASSLSLRYALAKRLIRSKNSFSADLLFPDRTLDRTQVRELLFDRFYHSPLREQERAQMDAYLAQLPPLSEWKHAQMVQVLEQLVQQPQFQLT